MNLTRGYGRLAAALAIMAVVACSAPSDTPTASTAPTSDSAPTASAPANPAPESPTASPVAAGLEVADSALSKIIVDSSGRTAYYFTKDQANSGKSACSGHCLTAWPAITTTSDTPPAEGITGKLGTITRDDGSKLATVNGMPIYLCAKDTAAGDTKGQGVNKVWYVIAPDGESPVDVD